MDWFEKLTGFRELDDHAARARLKAAAEQLVFCENGSHDVSARAKGAMVAHNNRALGMDLSPWRRDLSAAVT